MSIKRIFCEAGSKPVKIWTEDVEEAAEQQLRNIAGLPFIFKHVAVMADVHYGKGATIGSVIATRGAIIPAAVGTDIGCGMAAVRTNLTSADFGDGDTAAIRHSIERGVPVGFNSHKEPSEGALIWNEQKLEQGHRFETSAKNLCQLGTLGGGNHFIELCTDEEDRVWVTLHSGSRNLGKTIADQHINVAKKIAEQFFIKLFDPDLAYLAKGTKEFDSYVYALNFAQDYAMENRQLMLAEVVRTLLSFYDKRDHVMRFDIPINCHHNYVELENHYGRNVWVTRKGAVRARKDELGIIPGSMGARSFIVRGLGNEESFCSCSHGAGRSMSRSQAKKMFTIADLEAQLLVF